jgi:carboxypeptidase family protein
MKRNAILVGLGLAFGLAPATWAQSGRGTIRGMVRDQSGAVLPAVEIAATHQDTNIATAVRTNERGLYSVLNLPIGRYALTFRKDGFKALSRERITVGVNQAVDLDVELEVGGLGGHRHC